MDLKCASPFREKGAVRVPLLLWTRPDNPARFHVVECLVSIFEKRGLAWYIPRQPPIYIITPRRVLILAPTGPRC